MLRGLKRRRNRNGEMSIQRTLSQLQQRGVSAKMSSPPAPYRIGLREQDSAHPTLHLHLPASFLSTPIREDEQGKNGNACRAGVLVRMPPGVFIDTHTFPGSSAGMQRRDASSQGMSDALVSHVEMLNATKQTSQRLARDWDFTRVELERATGYSLVDRMDIRDAAAVESIVEASQNPEMPYEPTLAAASASDASPDANRLLVREFTAAVIWLDRFEPNDGNVIDAADEIVDTPPTKSAWSVDLAIPLHLRYALPLAGRSNARHYWRTAAQRLLHPKRYGTYRLRLLELPQAFWWCDQAISTDVGIYQSFEEPNKMLSPMHLHLSFNSLDRDQKAAAAGEGRAAKPFVYRLRLPARTPREPFRLRVPAARQEDAAPIVVVTFASLVIAAILVALAIHRTLAPATLRPQKHRFGAQMKEKGEKRTADEAHTRTV